MENSLFETPYEYASHTHTYTHHIACVFIFSVDYFISNSTISYVLRSPFSSKKMIIINRKKLIFTEYLPCIAAKCMPKICIQCAKFWKLLKLFSYIVVLVNIRLQWEKRANQRLNINFVCVCINRLCYLTKINIICNQCYIAAHNSWTAVFCACVHVNVHTYDFKLEIRNIFLHILVSTTCTNSVFIWDA